MLATRLCVREDHLSRSSCPRHGDRDPLVNQVIPLFGTPSAGVECFQGLERYRSCADAAAPCADHPGNDARARTARTRCRMKRRQFIVLVDGAAAASQDGSIASVYLRPCDPGDRMLRWHPTMIGTAPWNTKLTGIDDDRPRRDQTRPALQSTLASSPRSAGTPVHPCR